MTRRATEVAVSYATLRQTGLPNFITSATLLRCGRRPLVAASGAFGVMRPKPAALGVQTLGDPTPIARSEPRG